MSDDNEVRLMLHRSLGGAPIVLDVRREGLAEEMFRLAERAKLEQPEKYGAVRVSKTGPAQISFQLDDATSAFAAELD